MEPEEQLRVFQEMEKEGFELSAIYHSHPHTAAFPSQRDVDNAFYPDSLILIISLIEKELPQIGAFQIEKGKIERKAVRVTRKKGKRYPDNRPLSYQKYLVHLQRVIAMRILKITIID